MTLIACLLVFGFGICGSARGRTLPKHPGLHCSLQAVLLLQEAMHETEVESQHFRFQRGTIPSPYMLTLSERVLSFPTQTPAPVTTVTAGWPSKPSRQSAVPSKLPHEPPDTQLTKTACYEEGMIMMLCFACLFAAHANLSVPVCLYVRTHTCTCTEGWMDGRTAGSAPRKPSQSKLT